MCEHQYCRDCWREYLTIKIMDEGVGQVELVFYLISGLSSSHVDDTLGHILTRFFSVDKRLLHFFPGWFHSLQMLTYGSIQLFLSLAGFHLWYPLPRIEPAWHNKYQFIVVWKLWHCHVSMQTETEILLFANQLLMLLSFSCKFTLVNSITISWEGSE